MPTRTIRQQRDPKVCSLKFAVAVNSPGSRPGHNESCRSVGRLSGSKRNRTVPEFGLVDPSIFQGEVRGFCRMPFGTHVKIIRRDREGGRHSVFRKWVPIRKGYTNRQYSLGDRANQASENPWKKVLS